MSRPKKSRQLLNDILLINYYFFY